jgi:phage terminase large subunit-like protein
MTKKPPEPWVLSPFTAAAHQYALDLISGKRPACQLTIKAARRYLDDLAKSERADWPFRYDIAAATKACRFIEAMVHTKGKWSAKRETLKLEPWQAFFVCNVFGWLNKLTGKRRFRQAYLRVPRKNGKSALAAAIGLYMLTADGEAGAEVYSGASSEKQAWEVFGPARIMAMRNGPFKAKAKITTNASNLHVMGTGSKFEPVIGKPGDGASPSCAIIDEYHEHQTDDLVDTMITGMGAREQPLMLIITTAGSSTGGPCYAYDKDAQAVLSGTIERDELFVLIYGIDNQQRVVEYQSYRAVERLDYECRRVNAQITQIDQSVREAFACCVTRGIVVPTRPGDAKTTQTGRSETQNSDYAGLATSNTCSTETRIISAGQLRSAKSGLKKIETAAARHKQDGEVSQRRSAPAKTTNSATTTESQFQSMRDYVLSVKECVTSADVETGSFTSIIATLLEISEGYCVKSATQGSVFSEILKSLYARHSHILSAERCRLDGSSFYVTLPPDDWSSEASLVKANPNYDVSVSAEFLKARLAEAISSPRKAAIYKTKHLDEWVSAGSPYFDSLLWEGLKEEFDPAALAADGWDCYIGLDLASKKDLTAIVLLLTRFTEDGSREFRVVSRFYVPEAQAEDPKAIFYREWDEKGYLNLTGGNVIDEPLIESDIVELANLVGCLDIGYDPWGSRSLCQRLQDEHGLTVTEVPQTTKNLSEPMKTLDAAISSGRIRHDGNPVMAWCIGNVCAKEDKNENVFPYKERPEAKIDGAAALLNAMARALAAEVETTSVFDLLARKANANHAQSNDDDEAILANPAHPRWKEARERWERKHMSTDDIWG